MYICFQLNDLLCFALLPVYECLTAIYKNAVNNETELVFTSFSLEFTIQKLMQFIISFLVLLCFERIRYARYTDKAHISANSVRFCSGLLYSIHAISCTEIQATSDDANKSLKTGKVVGKMIEIAFCVLCNQ